MRRLSRARRLIAGFVVLLVVGLVLAVIMIGRSGPNEVGQSRRLADGSILKLRRVVFTATNSYTFSYQTGGRILAWIAPVLPQFLRSRLNLGGGSFGFGLDESTNLIAITIHRRLSRGTLAIGRLRLFDDAGDEYDACLSSVRQDLNWATNGTVEFLGALWPTENAWRLDVELVRIAGIPADQLWEVPLKIPAPVWGATCPAAGRPSLKHRVVLTLSQAALLARAIRRPATPIRHAVVWPR